MFDFLESDKSPHRHVVMLCGHLLILENPSGESRQALERLNLADLRGSIRSSSNSIAEYFGHFVNLMHLEFMADKRQVRRRRERTPSDKLVRWGWAMQNLRLLNTFGRREVVRCYLIGD